MKSLYCVFQDSIKIKGVQEYVSSFIAKKQLAAHCLIKKILESSIETRRKHGRSRKEQVDLGHEEFVRIIGKVLIEMKITVREKIMKKTGGRLASDTLLGIKRRRKKKKIVFLVLNKSKYYNGIGGKGK